MLKEKNAFYKSLNWPFLDKLNLKQENQIKKATTFAKKPEFWVYHDFKVIDKKTKVYWCKKNNNKCNLGCCEFLNKN